MKYNKSNLEALAEEINDDDFSETTHLVEFCSGLEHLGRIVAEVHTSPCLHSFSAILIAYHLVIILSLLQQSPFKKVRFVPDVENGTVMAIYDLATSESFFLT